MEDNNEQFKNEGNVSDAVFGTSSDAIIEGLHQGVLATQSGTDDTAEEGMEDKDQIVNEQDQQIITNTAEDDDYSSQASQPVPVSSTLKKGENDLFPSGNTNTGETSLTGTGTLLPASENDRID